MDALKISVPARLSPRAVALVAASLLALTSGCFPTHGGMVDSAGTEETGEAAYTPAECDPLRQDCAGDEACHALDETAVCTPAPEEGLGGYATPCSTSLECAPGLGCGPEVVLGCSIGFGCCTQYCDPSESSPCGSSFQCEAIYDAAPPQVPDVGLCVPL